MRQTSAEMSALSYLMPALRNIILQRGRRSDVVRDALADYLSEIKGAKVSHKEANRLLQRLLNAGHLYRTEHRKHLWYSVNPDLTVNDVTNGDLCRRRPGAE